ncbi:MAG: hypothetical protein WEB05_07040 [Solirubrobacterales bacterium]
MAETKTKKKPAAKKSASKSASKATAKKASSKKAAAKARTTKPRTAAQLHAEARAKAIHADKLDAQAAKTRLEEIEEAAVEAARTAVDIPVGAALNISDRVAEMIEPWTEQSSAEKKMKGYRADLTKTFKRAERRGTTARRKATRKVTKTRNSLERQVRRQQKSVEKQIKATNKDLNKQIETRVDGVAKRAGKAQAEVSRIAEVRGRRAQDMVNRVTEQLTQLV